MRDRVIDLLNFMHETLEANGCTPNTCSFNFAKAYTEHYFNAPSQDKPDAEDMAEFKQKYEATDDELDKAINIAKSNQYIKPYSHSGGFIITEDGRDYLKAYFYNEKYSKTTSSPQVVNIQQIHGNTQIGNHNIQNINIAFEQLIQEINNSAATPEQKTEAKSKFKAFLDNPIIAGVLTSTTAEALKKLLGL